MKALTLWRPWLWAIFHAPTDPKRVENRGWKPPAWLIGQRFALHAGQRFDAGAVEFIDEVVGASCPPKVDHPTGIIGTAQVVGWVQTGVKTRWSDGLDARRVHEVLLSPWTMRNGFAWVLDDVVVLPEAIPCRGAQGLWSVPANVVDLIEDPGLAALAQQRRAVARAADADVPPSPSADQLVLL